MTEKDKKRIFVFITIFILLIVVLACIFHYSLELMSDDDLIWILFMSVMGLATLNSWAFVCWKPKPETDETHQETAKEG